MSGRLPFHRSLYVAIRGFIEAFATERNVRIQGLIATAVIAVGCYVQLSSTEWVSIILCIGTVISCEIMNTAIEATVNLLAPEHKEQARKAKDFAAGSVLVVSLTAIAVGIIIFGGHLLW